MIKAKVSAGYKDIERIFAGGSIQKEILKVWSTEANAYVFEAWKVLEIEGPLPLTIRANGEALIDYRIYGNAEQTVTPTPENPIMPIGCGERTENLFDEVYPNLVVGQAVKYEALYVGEGQFTLSTNCPLVQTDIADLFFLSGNVSSGASTNANGVWNEQPRTVASLNGYVTVGYRKFSNMHPLLTDYNVMLNTGSTALPYEPYGYKLPILSNSTVTNIYLGEVETTRRIKKLVLTGEENWKKRSHNNTKYTFEYGQNVRIIKGLCSHYAGYTSVLIDKVNGIYLNNTITIIITDLRFTADADFKSFLAAQYAAGTPVTIWYVLAEPETGIVNEPLMKIGDYADTINSTQAEVQIPTSKGTTVIDYDGEKRFITSDGYELVDKNQNGFILSGSTLRPSKMYIKYKGR